MVFGAWVLLTSWGEIGDGRERCSATNISACNVIEPGEGSHINLGIWVARLTLQLRPSAQIFAITIVPASGFCFGSLRLSLPCYWCSGTVRSYIFPAGPEYCPLTLEGIGLLRKVWRSPRLVCPTFVYERLFASQPASAVSALWACLSGSRYVVSISYDGRWANWMFAAYRPWPRCRRVFHSNVKP